MSRSWAEGFVVGERFGLVAEVLFEGVGTIVHFAVRRRDVGAVALLVGGKGRDVEDVGFAGIEDARGVRAERGVDPERAHQSRSGLLGPGFADYVPDGVPQPHRRLSFTKVSAAAVCYKNTVAKV